MENSICANGHPTQLDNKFCTSCGVILERYHATVGNKSVRKPIALTAIVIAASLAVSGTFGMLAHSMSKGQPLAITNARTEYMSVNIPVSEYADTLDGIRFGNLVGALNLPLELEPIDCEETWRIFQQKHGSLADNQLTIGEHESVSHCFSNSDNTISYGLLVLNLGADIDWDYRAESKFTQEFSAELASIAESVLQNGGNVFQHNDQGIGFSTPIDPEASYGINSIIYEDGFSVRLLTVYESSHQDVVSVWTPHILRSLHAATES